MVTDPRDSTGSARLVARALEFGYADAEPVLHSISLSLAESEFVVVLGPNGAGKSTLLRLLAGVATPWSGTVELAGLPIDRHRPRDRARSLAVVPQALERVPQVTTRTFVEAGRYAHVTGFGRRRPEDRAAVDRALCEVELEDRAEVPLNELSGGQLQRALIARALAQEPEVLLVDEPTSSLDLSHQLSIFELIGGLTCLGRSVLCVTHDLNLASQFATRILLMCEGRIVADGSASDVLTPEVLGPVYGDRLRFGQLPGPKGDGTRPWILPWGG